MAKLDAAERNELPKKEFGEPGAKKYPMPDKNHAANAKARATQMLNKGVISESEHAKILAKANAILGHKGVSRVSVDHDDGKVSGYITLSKSGKSGDGKLGT